jgi:ketosteroid isomerase-like protein
MAALGSPAVDEEAMAATVARYWDELWTRRDLDVIDELFAEKYVRHSSAGTRVLRRDDLKREVRAAWRLLHDAVTTVDDQVVDGDRVWTRATTEGVNLDTGEPSVLTWLVVQRLADGRIVESWNATMPGVDWRR